MRLAPQASIRNKLAVVVFCGRSAQRAIPLLRLPSHVQVLSTFNPGAQSYNRQECREAIHETFRLANGEVGRSR